MIARNNLYLIARPGDDRPLVDPSKGYDGGTARQVVERLEHIERWKSTAELQNPDTTIGADELEIQVLYKGEELKGTEQRLAYEPPGARRMRRR